MRHADCGDGSGSGQIRLLDRVPKVAADAPKISQFRSWLIEQVQDDKAAVPRNAR